MTFQRRLLFRRLRLLLVAAVLVVARHLPVSSEIFGPPKGFYRTTKGWFKARARASAASRLHEIVREFATTRRLPVGWIASDLPWPFTEFYDGLKVVDPAGWVAEIPGGRVAGEGAVITPDDCLLADVSREQIAGGDQSRHSIRSCRRLPRVQKLSGRVGVIAVSGAANYWHWFFDVLPRLLLLEELPGGLAAVDRLVVNEITHPFQRETLAWLGVPPEKLVPCRQSGFHVKADVLLVPSLFVETPTRWACRQLRERLAPMPGASQGPRRIYISRDDATIRRVLNEDELVHGLVPLGFEVVRLTGRTLREQAVLFSSAEVVVAPHGAGLTNLLFSREGTRVLEILPPNYLNPCYWVLSDQLGLEYRFVLGEGPLPPPPPPGANCDLWFWSIVEAHRDTRQNFRVNVAAVLAALGPALADSGAQRATG